ncbi:MAG: DUF4007 family protein [Selenomonas sp.]|nr:DUF4007 family protein [Selenomonas sp.]
MKFKGHESFYIRRGWLYKGLKHVRKREDIFLAKDAMEEMGLGSNMVKSLRYWLQATGLTKEISEGGRRIQRLTPLGKLVWKHDPYMEEMGTLWLLHLELASNRDLATSWYEFFNEFSMQEFQKEDFVRFLQGKAEAAESSLSSDFDCLMSTYIPRSLLKGKVDPESNMECPMGNLQLIGCASAKEKIYRRQPINGSSVPECIFMSGLLKESEGRTEISLQEILSGRQDKPGIGRMFQLDLVALLEVLYKLEKREALKVVRTAGLDVVRLSEAQEPLAWAGRYYQELSGEG